MKDGTMMTSPVDDDPRANKTDKKNVLYTIVTTTLLALGSILIVLSATNVIPNKKIGIILGILTGITSFGMAIYFCIPKSTLQETSQVNNAKIGMYGDL